MARKRKIFRVICAEFFRAFGRASHIANILIACSSYPSELNRLKDELSQGRVSQVTTILCGGNLMNKVTDCRNKLSDVLQTGQVCHRFICVIHLTQRAQFALTLDRRFAQDAEYRKVRTLLILNHDFSTDVAINAIRKSQGQPQWAASANGRQEPVLQHE